MTHLEEILLRSNAAQAVPTVRRVLAWVWDHVGAGEIMGVVREENVDLARDLTVLWALERNPEERLRIDEHEVAFLRDAGEVRVRWVHEREFWIWTEWRGYCGDRLYDPRYVRTFDEVDLYRQIKFAMEVTEQVQDGILRLEGGRRHGA